MEITTVFFWFVFWRRRDERTGELAEKNKRGMASAQVYDEHTASRTQDVFLAAVIKID
jgi:hypothetical protein